MKKALYQYLLLSVTVCALASCTKKFTDLNQNPNQVAMAAPESLLAPALYDVINTNLSRGFRINNDLMQVSVFLGDTREIHRYVIRPTESDAMWNGWYLQLNNFRDMYTGAKAINSKSYMGISLILDAWVSSMITDMFGDVPYSEATQGKNYVLTPKFDKQQDIYTDLFAKLDSANVLLAANETLTDQQKTLDPLYQGDITRWRKFGNSLYLRLLLRVSARPEMHAAERISNMVGASKANYPVFTANSESAVLKFTGVSPYFSPFYTYRAIDFQSAMTEYFINTLANLGDPRLTLWATRYNNEYAGMPSGYPASQVVLPQSRLQDALKNNPQLGNIMSYAELQLILAEASAKGMITAGPAKTYYENGITAAITQWGLTVPATYLSAARVAWSDAASLDDKLEKIHVQKYFANFFTDFQQWTEYRRTGHPVLPIGSGVRNDRQMPTRLVYPVIVQSVNRESYNAAVASMGGADNMLTKVWWNN